MLFENSLIFFPTRYPQWWTSPAGFDVEDAWFTADDGTQLHGWYLPIDEPRAVVLFAHGNAGNLSDRGPRMDGLRRRHRVSVMIFDYRGYGRSEGRPSERGVLADARAARTWLAQRAGVPPGEIVLMGRSLGAAVMVDLAAAEGARGLIVESTFTSIPDVAACYYPGPIVRALLRTELNSLTRIGRYDGPLLASHSRADTVIPFELGRRLFDAANEPKRFVEFEHGDHNDPLPPEYDDALDAFLAQLPPTASAGGK